MADDGFEGFENEAAGIDEGSAEDIEQARQATDEQRKAIYEQLLDAARKMQPGSSFEHLLWTACHNGLPEGQLDALKNAIAATTKTTKAALNKDHKRIAGDVAEAQAARRRQQAEQAAEAARKRNASDPALAAAEKDYPLTDKAMSYQRHEDRIWAGTWRKPPSGGDAVFVPLHTQWTIDGQVYYPPDDFEGLRVSVLSSKNVRTQVHLHLGRLQDVRGASEVMTQLADAGLRVGKLGRAMILEQLATGFHTRIIMAIERSGWHVINGSRQYVDGDGSVTK